MLDAIAASQFFEHGLREFWGDDPPDAVVRATARLRQAEQLTRFRDEEDRRNGGNGRGGDKP